LVEAGYRKAGHWESWIASGHGFRAAALSGNDDIICVDTGNCSDSKVPSKSLNAHFKATSSSFKHQSSILSCRPCGHALRKLLRITSNDERPTENGNPRRESERVTSRTELSTVGESHPTSLTDYNVSRSDGRLLRSAFNPYDRIARECSTCRDAVGLACTWVRETRKVCQVTLHSFPTA
jgi:hypothetical protein